MPFTLMAVSMSACAIPGSTGLIGRAAAIARMLETREPTAAEEVRDPRCPEGK